MAANSLFVKICGITNMDDALGCAKLGVDAIGFVFYEKSPRYITPGRAAEIIREINDHVRCFGVFVNLMPEKILRIRDSTGIHVAQLHGNEPPDWTQRLEKEALTVCKAFFARKKPSFADLPHYSCSMALFESGKHGYGGTGRVWNWGEVAEVGAGSEPAHNTASVPIILAGGLTPDNVVEAVRSARPDGIDLSSGVEKEPGKKDLEKVRLLLESLKELEKQK